MRDISVSARLTRAVASSNSRLTAPESSRLTGLLSFSGGDPASVVCVALKSFLEDFFLLPNMDRNRKALRGGRDQPIRCIGNGTDWKLQ